jgi:hypothetical protein
MNGANCRASKCFDLNAGKGSARFKYEIRNSETPPETTYADCRDIRRNANFAGLPKIPDPPIALVIGNELTADLEMVIALRNRNLPEICLSESQARQRFNTRWKIR